ncbi:MAG: transglycosylase domain-containing protein [Bacteroidota bacterium]
MSAETQSPGRKGLRAKFDHVLQRWLTFRDQKPIAAWSLLLGGGLAASALLLVIGLVLLVRLGAFGALPSKTDLAAIQNNTASEVYSADGVLLGKYYIENRTLVDYEDISPDLLNALVATEDARFFNHGGIDMRAWVRVLLKTILLGDDSGGGGSTLSQQLAKNLYARQRYYLFTIPINKLKEMFVARRLEKVYSKDELLSLYLNTVPFGGNIFGVQVAAKQFFNTSAKDIKTEEAAVLIGMLKANTYYNPVRNPQSAQKRRNTVLNQMKKYDYLSTNECDSLKALPLVVHYQRESTNEGQATYFREFLRQELAEKVKSYQKPNGQAYNLYTDGLKIYTTINAEMQHYAEMAVQEQLTLLQKDFDKHWKGRQPWGSPEVLKREVRKSQRYKSLDAQGLSEAEILAIFEEPVSMTIFTWKGDQQKEMSPLDSIKYYYCLLNAGFLAMNPTNGHIKAWVGGIDHQYFKYDHVRSKRQVGSTFKPIVYASAIQNGFRPCDYYFNRLVTYTDYEDWQPHNADGQYGGVYSMQGALSKSVNSVAVDLIIRNGVASVRTLAQEMGMTSKIPEVPAIALGAVDASLYEMITIYGTLANRGLKHQPQYVLRIEAPDGTVLVDYEEAPSLGTRVLDQADADIMTEMMQAVVDSGTARRLRYQYGLYGDIAGKTGTTQSHADGWFIGFTPKLVAGAWVGGEYPSVRFRSLRLGQGGNTALPIWGRFMRKVHGDKQFKGYKNAQFQPPSLAVSEALDCLPYYESELALVQDTTSTIDSFDEALDALFNAFRKKEKRQVNKQDAPINASPRDILIKKRKKESEAIKKRNEKKRKKRERKKKRKEVFDKLFKKKN